MATIEKLIKAFEGLKVFQPELPGNEEVLRQKDKFVCKKDKIAHCNCIADCICSLTMRCIAEFPKFLGIAIETFFSLCNDTEADVRIAASECLNRTIKILLQTNLGHIQMELFKEIKKNGPSQSLRTALCRFSDICHLIRPQRCRPYAVNLFPHILRISHREEETIQETLSNVMPKICSSLVAFTSESEIKVLLKTFIRNLMSSSVVHRRTAANSLSLICLFSGCPHKYFTYLLTVVLELVLPVNKGGNVYTILGVLLCFRHTLQNLNKSHFEKYSPHVKSSVASSDTGKDGGVNKELLLKVLQLLLYCFHHHDHNVVTASLETMVIMLQHCRHALHSVLLVDGGITETFIFQADLIKDSEQSDSVSDLASLSGDAELSDDLDMSDVNLSSSAACDGENFMFSSTFHSELQAVPSSDNENSQVDQVTSSVENIDRIDCGSIGNSDTEYTNVPFGILTDDHFNIPNRSEISDLPSENSIESNDLLTKYDVECFQLDIIKHEMKKNPENCMAELIDNDVVNTAESHAVFENADRSVCFDIDCLVSDRDCPLLCMLRLICKKFLLTGEEGKIFSDCNVRVCLKSLALSCVASIFSWCPKLALKKLPSLDEYGQNVSDVLLFAAHPDHQLKGLTACIVSSLIQAILCEGHGDFNHWLQEQHSSDNCAIELDQLVKTLMLIMEDQSAVAIRYSLRGVKQCLPFLLDSSHGSLGLHVLLNLFKVKNNPYWLVKVELLNIFSSLSFNKVSYLYAIYENIYRRRHLFYGKFCLQQNVLQDIIMNYLGDSDHRVRKAAATTLFRLLPHLFFSMDSHHCHDDAILSMVKSECDALLHPLHQKFFMGLPPVVHGLVSPYHFNELQDIDPTIESSLSRVVQMMVQQLLTSRSRFLIGGCTHVLYLLSQKYFVTQYPSAWSCGPVREVINSDLSSSPYSYQLRKSFGVPSSLESATEISGGPLQVILSMMLSTPAMFDLSCHQDMLRLAGNLIAGSAYHCLKLCDDLMSVSPEYERRWCAVTDRSLVKSIDLLLCHVCRILSACCHIIAETAPVQAQARTALPLLTNASSISPIKRKVKVIEKEAGLFSPGIDSKTSQKAYKEIKETDKEKNKHEEIGAFYFLPQYMKLYQYLCGGYSNYKTSTSLCENDKFCAFLRSALEVMAQLLEIATFSDIGNHIEVFLSYFKSTVILEPGATFLCIQQLLKTLFGANLPCQWASDQDDSLLVKDAAAEFMLSPNPGLYRMCFEQPYADFSKSFLSCSRSISAKCELEDFNRFFILLKKRIEKKVPVILQPSSKVDKSLIGSYIRLFEPLVVKAMKLYTTTSSLELQRQILDILIQLIQLRVNYCLLDSDLIFLGFVLRQLEYIEEGHMRNSDILLPSMFTFLVMLSNEKYHSKPIIDMPHIIQRCDGVLASCLNPETHVLPAMMPVIHNLYLLCGSDVSKDLETQREVVVSMLLRLINYNEMFIIILRQCQCECVEKWKSMSRTVTDTILLALARQQITIDCQLELDTLHHLFEAVAPCVFRPVDILLKTLFTSPLNWNDVSGVERWMCLILALLRVLLSHSNEDAMLSRLEEMDLHIGSLFAQLHCATISVEGMAGTSGYLSADTTLACFLLQVTGKCVDTVWKEVAVVGVMSISCHFLNQLITRLLLYITYILQSGRFRRVAAAAASLLDNEALGSSVTIHQISERLLFLGRKYPILALHWCNVITLLNCSDRTFWSQVLQTRLPIKAFVSSSLEENEQAGDVKYMECCNLKILQRGGLILLSVLMCANPDDQECMIWFIDNHVNDLIELTAESPVQDFISAMHRDSVTSAYFIQAIKDSREHINSPSSIMKTMQCLDAAHHSQSASLVSLLVNKFLVGHQLSVSRKCEAIVCRRLEGLIAETAEEGCHQLSQDKLEQLVHFMTSSNLAKRHEHLFSLLEKLRTLACFPPHTPQLSEAYPLIFSEPLVKNMDIDKECFLEICRAQCNSCSPTHLAECASMLEHLDHANILSIFMSKEFNLSILAECISLGSAQSNRQNSEIHCHELDINSANPLNHLLQASVLTLFNHISNVVVQLPVKHNKLSRCLMASSSLDQYTSSFNELFLTPGWLATNCKLAEALFRFAASVCRFPQLYVIPAGSWKDVCRFAVLLLEMSHWSILCGILPTFSQLQISLQCVACVLQNVDLREFFAQDVSASWVCSMISGLYQLLISVFMSPGEKLTNHHTLCADDVNDEGISIFIQACHEMSIMVGILHTKMHHSGVESHYFPSFLTPDIDSIIISLARLPLVNSFARTPPMTWQLGWSPTLSGTHHTQLLPLPIELLQEKSVLMEFVLRLNTLGWTSRQQFEENWMNLLAVLNSPSSTGASLSFEENLEHSHIIVIAVRAITSLLLNAMLVPRAGDTTSGQFKAWPRDKPICFLTTRYGKRLSAIREILEHELRQMRSTRSVTMDGQLAADVVAQLSQTPEDDPQAFELFHCPTHQSDGVSHQRTYCACSGLFRDNLESECCHGDYNIGQISLESIWAVVGSLETPTNESAPESTPDLWAIEAGQVPTADMSPTNTVPSVISSEVDIRSCLQFLMDLYSAWLHVDNSPKPCLMLINSVVKSIVCLSDLFMEREQFEFMLDILLGVSKSHPTEDELVNQYLVVGLAKATAVVGADSTTSEAVMKHVEQSLKSTHLPTKVAALHAILYLLEGGLSDVTRALLPIVCDYLLQHQPLLTQSSMTSENFVRTLWATIFFMSENYHNELKDSDFLSTILQLVTRSCCGSADGVTPAVFCLIMKGLERLLMTGVLSSMSGTEAVVKLSLDRFFFKNPQKAFAALGLFLTCMYSGKLADVNDPSPLVGPIFTDIHQQHPESLVLAMERVTILFDRIKKSYPYEARVIANILPSFLADFFPSQDVMNKVIGEFLSNQQPYPNFIAKVVFQVFTDLHRQSQQAMITEWVLLSLSNFTQRSPVSMALWSLTCFFISASTNKWLRALFPYVLGRMAQLDATDRRLFCLAAIDFYQHLTDGAQRESFTSTFQADTTAHSPYNELLTCLLT